MVSITTPFARTVMLYWPTDTEGTLGGWGKLAAEGLSVPQLPLLYPPKLTDGPQLPEISMKEFGQDEHTYSSMGELVSHALAELASAEPVGVQGGVVGVSGGAGDSSSSSSSSSSSLFPEGTGGGSPGGGVPPPVPPSSL